MSLKAIGTAVTTKIGRQILTVQKHSPVMLFGIGVAGFVGTVFLATKATLQLPEIIEEAEVQLEKAKLSSLKDENKKALAGVYMRSAIKVARLYAPAVGVGLVTIGALTSSHVIMTRRNAALGASYAVVQKAFNDYRERVVEELGEEKDLEFKHGAVIREVAVDTDDGVMIKTVKHFDSTKVSGYARIFDEFNPVWEKTPERNYMFLKAQESYLNNLLNRRGHVFLNEVYAALGFSHSKEGALVGWIIRDGYDKGDGYIDFGLDNPGSRDFVNGFERSVVLDFNVDGVIYDLI